MIECNGTDVAQDCIRMAEQMTDWGFQPSRPRGRVDELIALWRRARSVAESMPACPCHGIVSGVIDPDVMEHNMLAPLRARYRDEGHAELVALVEQRLRKSPFAGMRAAFPGWVQSLAQTPLAAGARSLLYDDLQAALQFYADATPQFTCA
jgi:hypothetical protein